MTTPQDPGKRNRQKARRTKQLAAWRTKHEAAPPAPPAPPAAAKATPATTAAKPQK
jgi:hypothetical protein